MTSDHTAEHGDSPDTAEMLTLIVEVGNALNRSSYPVPRITQVIHDICTAYGHDIATQVFANYIIALDESAGRVRMANTGSMYRFDQIAEAEALVHRLREAGVPISQAIDEFGAIADSRPPVNPLVRGVGYALMALGFAFCFRMSAAATVAAVLVSIPAATILLWSNVKGALAALMPVLLTFLSALVITLWAVHGGLPDPVRLAVIPVVTLIPGAALATALIEITAGDMIAGTTRLVYSLVVLLSMAFGLALAIDIVGLTSADLQDLTSSQAPSWVLWPAAPIFGLGTMLYFCTPRWLWLWVLALTVGTFWLNHFLVNAISSAFAGGVAIGTALLVAWTINAYAKGRPSVLAVFLPSFWLIVPGSMGFVAVSGAITADHQLDSLGTNAALSVLSIAISMMIASVIAPFITRQHWPTTWKLLLNTR